MARDSSGLSLLDSGLDFMLSIYKPPQKRLTGSGHSLSTISSYWPGPIPWGSFWWLSIAILNWLCMMKSIEIEILFHVRIL